VESVPRRRFQEATFDRGNARGTESLQTRRWRELDSNFQYAGAVNLVVAPFMPPKARDASKRPGPDRRGRSPCRRRTPPNFAGWGP
jgi:hypothetical protein